MSEKRLLSCDGSAHSFKVKPTIRAGTASDIQAIKSVADREKHALGFVHRGSLSRAVARDELVVASSGTMLVGFCQFYWRRDGVVTIYHVAVVPEARGEGIGHAMIAHIGRVAADRGTQVIRLKCPVDLLANGFYARIGFRLVAVEAARVRPLNVWELCCALHLDGDNATRYAGLPPEP